MGCRVRDAGRNLERRFYRYLLDHDRRGDFFFRRFRRFGRRSLAMLFKDIESILHFVELLVTLLQDSGPVNLRQDIGGDQS